MGRPVASLQAEIDVLEAQLPKLLRAASYSIAGRSKTNVAYDNASKRLDQLYQQLGRANGTAPMLVRGVVTGLGRTSP